MKNKMMTEKKIERYLAAKVKAVGGISYKLTCQGTAGLPDRLVLFPEGKAGFVELKKPGGKLRKRQEAIIKKLRGLGFSVFVIDSKLGVDNMFMPEGVGK
jgi:hypothetical protein